MRSKNIIVVSTVLASLSLAAPALADDTSMLAPMTPSATLPPPSPPPVVAPAATTSTTSTTSTTGADVETSMTPPPSPATTTRNPDTITLYDHRRPNRALLVTGAGIFATTYTVTAGVTGAEGAVRDHDLYIPVVGPWINLASRDSNVNNNTRDSVLIAGSGVLQGVGVGMLIMSFFVPEKVATATIAKGPVKMLITPTAAAGSGGVGAIGTF